MRLPSDVVREPYFNYMINGNWATGKMLEMTTEFQFTESDEKSDSGRITIADPTLAIFDGTWIVEGAKIVMYGGYLKYHRLLMNGYIAGLSPNFDSTNNGTPALTLICMDGTYVMSINKKTRSWKNIKRSDAVRTICMSYGIKAVVQDTITVEKTLSQSDETDIAFITRLASEVGFVSYMRGGVFYFKERNLAGASLGTFYFNSGDSSLISFSPQFTEMKNTKLQAGTPVGYKATPNKTVKTGVIANKKVSNQHASAPSNHIRNRMNR